MYMAPEMLIVDSKFDQRIEAWSLGIILCKMLTGKCPFQSSEEARLVKKIVLEEIDFVDDVYSNISIEGQDLIENLLNKKQEHRLTIKDIIKHSWIVDVTLND